MTTGLHAQPRQALLPGWGQCRAAPPPSSLSDCCPGLDLALCTSVRPGPLLTWTRLQSPSGTGHGHMSPLHSPADLPSSRAPWQQPSPCSDGAPVCPWDPTAQAPGTGSEDPPLVAFPSQDQGTPQVLAVGWGPGSECWRAQTRRGRDSRAGGWCADSEMAGEGQNEAGRGAVSQRPRVKPGGPSPSPS